MRVTFSRREPVAADTYTFWFMPEKSVQYLPGQFTEIRLPHAADERGERRWFTLSSSPTEKAVAITTKILDDGSTFKKELFALKPGSELDLADPMGDFVPPKDPAIPLLFFAAGLGITPVRSIAKWLADTGERRDVRIFYAVTHEDQLAFKPLLSAYGLTPIVKKPTASYRGETGSATVNHLLTLAKDEPDSLIFISGPESMTESLYKGLKAKGVAEERLVTDYFPGYRSF